MAKKKEVSVGEIIQIPIGDGDSVRAVILFLSRHYRDVMLIGAPFSISDSHVESGVLCSEISVLLYSSQQCVLSGRWPVVGQVALESTDWLSERIVADRVWFADDPVREVSAIDRQRLPVMRPAGEGAVEQMLAQLMGGNELSKMTKKIARESKWLLSRCPAG